VVSVGGGKDVAICGTFSNWETIPMVKSHGDFVTIIDLPEGEHQYRYYVDGEWKNDPHSSVVENESTGKGKLLFFFILFPSSNHPICQT